MAWQMIPTDSSPNCRKNALLTIAGERKMLAFFFRFNPIGEYWTMDVARAETGETLLTGVPLVCGEGAAMDLLRQLSYLAIGRAACVPVSDGLARDRPGEAGLGTDFELCWEG